MIDDLVGEFDAGIWVREWIEIYKANPHIASDESTMRAWFANAIMAGYDKGRREEKERSIVEVLREMMFQAAGAATRPLLEDHPNYIFPSERVVEAVEEVCRQFGIPEMQDDPYRGSVENT